MTGPDPKPPAIPRDRLMAETRLTALRARMAEAEAAHRLIAENGTVGKVLLTLD